MDVCALAFPTAHDLHFSTDVTLPGMNSFSGAVKLLNFQLPCDAPGGAGIEFVATTGLANPSAFDVGLGTVAFDLSFDGLFLGRSVSPPNTTVIPGEINVILSGTLMSQSGSADLATLSRLFTQYLNGETSAVRTRGASSTQPDGAAVSWR